MAGSCYLDHGLSHSQITAPTNRVPLRSVMMVGMTFEERREMAAIKELAQKSLAELSSHTAVCAQRQGDLSRQVATLTKILISATGVMLVGAVGTVLNLILHFPPAH